jgi:alcohol dehydrogenase class IV
MLTFFTRFFYPKEIVVKKGSIQRLKFIKNKKPLLIFSNSSEKNGTVEKIKSMLPEIDLLKVISGEPKASYIDIYAKKDLKNDVIIAIGGGSVIDTAKLIITNSISEHSIEEIKPFSLSDIHNKKPDFIAIPTTVGSGSESDGVAVVEYNKKKLPIVSDLLVPDLVILDPMLVQELPKELLFKTALDAFSHGFESYFSRITNEFSRMVAISASSNTILGLKDINSGTENVISYEKLLYASYLAGLAQSTTSVGIIHAISHVISPKVNMSHGHINSLLIPHIIEFYNKKGVDVLSFVNGVGFEKIDEAIKFFNDQTMANNISLIQKDILVIDEELILEIKNDMCFKTSPILINENEIKTILEKIIG